jgi:hypothetical protein
MTTITLNSRKDVTSQVKQDLLDNKLDKLIINFDTRSDTGSSVIFDQKQETIDFDIEVNSDSAEDLFLNLKNLEAIKKSLNLSEVYQVNDLFSGCEKLLCLPQLNFGRHSHCCVDRYHLFCDYDLRKDAGLNGIRESYLEKEHNLYPSWYFRSAISGNVFDFRIFFDEIFKFIFSYRGLGLDTWSSPFFKCQINKIGKFFDRIKYAIDNKSCCFDLDNISYSNNPHVKFSEDLFRYLRTDDRHIFHEFEHFAYCKCHSSRKYEIDSLADFFERLSDFEYLYDQFPLNGFTIEFSDKKKYFKTGKYKITEVVEEGNVLLEKYSGDSQLSDIIRKVLDALENKGKETPDPDSKNIITSDEFAEKSKKALDEIIEHNHEVLIEVSDRHPDRDSCNESDESDDRHNDGCAKEPDEITVSLYDIDLSVLDDLPDDLPEDIKEWTDKVRDIETLNLMLGCFVPGAYPLKIVMFTEVIKETAKSNGISALHLFETTLAHEFFHALHFVMCLLEKFSDISLIADIFKGIMKNMDPNRISAQNVHREIWLQLQKETLNHWYPVHGKDITSQVLEPLAVAFEISWVKDRIITQQDSSEWQKLMKYELSRFGGLGCYPSDPYCGAKYLISSRKNHRKLADIETVNTNIAAVLQRSLDSMRSAYVLIQNSLAW